MSTRTMSRFLSIGLAGSFLAHGVAYAALGGAPRLDTARPLPSSVEFEVAAPEPPAPPPPPEPERLPEPEPAPERTQALPPAAKAAPAPEPVKTEAPPPVKAVDLSGLTLTNDSGDASWSSPRGDGGERQGVLGAIGSAGKASHVPLQPAPARSAAPVAPSLVASGDLSEKPRPPALDAALRRHYPAEARMRAISGSASLRVRIDADGRVRSASLLSESFAGFGDACRSAVVGSRWSPPRDQAGRAVATEVRYTCRFVVD